MSQDFQTILDQSRRGDEDASSELFRRYVEQLTQMARARLSPQLARRLDPEDIVHSAYRSFFVRLRQDQFELEESLDLWKLLVRIVHNKVARASRHHRAERRSYNQEQRGHDLHTLVRSEPGVDEVVIFNEQVARLLAQFQGQTRQIVELKLQGYLQQEIADQLGCSERTVRRAISRVREWIESDQQTSTSQPIDGVEEGDSFETHPSFVSDSEYLIQRFVGQGGYGRLYRALDRQTGETVAVKFLKKRFLNDREIVSQFLQEAKAAARFETPGIVPIRALGRTRNGQLFLVMDYVEGRHLGEWRENHENRWDEIRSIIFQSAELLDRVHQDGLLHLDIKPQNLLIDPNDQVWLTDFGMAQFRNATAGRLRGTLPFLAPEQIDSAFGPLSRRTDFYGLGTVLFLLLTGEDFVRADTVDNYFSKITEERRGEAITERLPDAVPKDLKKLSVALLERDPERRLSSAANVQAILNRQSR